MLSVVNYLTTQMTKMKLLSSTASRPAKSSRDETVNISELPPSQMTVHLPEHAGSLRNLDFSKYYGRGCDAIVFATQHMLELMTKSCIESEGKTRSATTIAVYYSNGLSVFLPFCAMMALTLERDLRLDDVDPMFINYFITHLRQSGFKDTSQRALYSQTKSVLVAIGQSGWIAKDIFPRNPFPNSNRRMKGQTTLSEPERWNLLKALKTDMRTIISGSGPLTSDDLVVCILAIGLRTGINPTPALELLTDCLLPHPIKADRYVLVSFKRRGSSTHLQSIRRATDIESIVSALPDVARIINLVLERNSELRQASDYPKLLFVYESRTPWKTAETRHLSGRNLSDGIQKFVKRHKLANADGEPLKLNIMRLRKTYENRLFTLSGQDPFLTARLGGHSLKISNDHYLEAPQNAEREWRLMGEIRVDKLLNQSNAEIKPTLNTPVARCRDTLNGELAPKNGEHCQKFLGCFRCRSFVVTGDDLYRVFSLYWMLIRMRQTMRSDAWSRIYGHIIRIIDREIAPKFDAEYVAIQRQRSKTDPHPFWRNSDQLVGTT